jgi:DnaJ-class molecular chaperone
MNKFEPKSPSTQAKLKQKNKFAHTHYGMLGLHPSASSLEIRKAYRELSKLYHPDTTELESGQAKNKFQQLNEAYGVLSNPQRRSLYDLNIGYSRWNVIQPSDDFHNLHSDRRDSFSNSAYLDPNDRPLSEGEIFALFIMGITLLGCLLLAIAIAWLRGDALY